MEFGGKLALALVADGLRDGGNVILRFQKQRRGLLHAVLFHVRGDRLAVDLLEAALERRRVHQILPRQLLNGDALGEIGRQLVVDMADDLLLRVLIVDSLFRAGDLHDLLDDLVQELDLHGVARLIIDLLAAPAAFDQPALRK